MQKQPRVLTQEQLQLFETEGYLIVKGLFRQEEVSEIEATFEEISHTTVPGHFEPVLDEEVVEPLKRYPRVMHPHRFNPTAMKYMLHKPVMDVLADLYGEPALAAQSMFYYKPRVPAVKRCTRTILPAGRAGELYRGVDRNRCV